MNAVPMILRCAARQPQDDRLRVHGYEVILWRVEYGVEFGAGYRTPLVLLSLKEG